MVFNRSSSPEFAPPQRRRPRQWRGITPARLAVRATGCLLVLLAVGANAQVNTFFRVINEQGVVELKSTITPAEAKRGYSIVSLGGNVVKEVAPELSDEEYAALSEEMKAQREFEERKEQAQLYDESLLLRYSSVIDLQAERKRKLSEFDVRISILRNNLYSLKEKAVSQQARAANIERQGGAVPIQLANNILDLESEMREAEASIAARIIEKQKVAEKYDVDAVRLAELLTRTSR